LGSNYAFINENPPLPQNAPIAVLHPVERTTCTVSIYSVNYAIISHGWGSYAELLRISNQFNVVISIANQPPHTE
jgi:hypothetical protein